MPLAPGAPGAADPVDVVLGLHREVEVDDDRELLDVEAARGDVGRDEDLDLAGLEVGEGADPLGLGAVGVDRGGGEAVAVQVRGDPPGGDLRAREDEDLAQVVGPDEVLEELELELPVHGVEDLADRRGRGVAGGDLDRRGVGEELLRQAPDLVGERRREEECLAAVRQELEDPPDVRDEPHVEHPVALVEDEDLDLAEVRRPLADEVEEATGRRDEQLDAGSAAP